jgi:sortase A
MKKIFAILLIIIGLITIALPKLNELHSSHIQERLLEDWEKGKNNASTLNITKGEGVTELERAFAGAINENSEVLAAEPELQNKDKSHLKVSQQNPQMIGTIAIKKINVFLPIVEGAGQKELKIAAGHVRGTALPGKKGNMAIAAHRSHTYGRFFNRLNEVEEGDLIIVKDKQSTYKYKVINKYIVKPNNMSVLTSKKDQSLLTLITCHPLKVATHRLIIQAILTHRNSDK